jgi:hypothetical protein
MGLEAIVRGGSKTATLIAITKRLIDDIQRSIEALDEDSEVIGARFETVEAYAYSLLAVLTDGTET